MSAHPEWGMALGSFPSKVQTDRQPPKAVQWVGPQDKPCVQRWSLNLFSFENAFREVLHVFHHVFILCAHTRATALVRRSGSPREDPFSASPLWGLRIELRSPGLAAGASSPRAVSQAQALSLTCRAARTVACGIRLGWGVWARAGRQLGTQALPLCSQQKTELPVTENVQTIPPPYVVRTILVYSRPPCQPQFSLTEPMKVSPEGRESSG